MNTIAIVGLGNVGMAYAYSLMNQSLELENLILIDVEKEKLLGKTADLQHSLYNLPWNPHLHIHAGSYADCKNADIVCITAGVPQSTIKKSRMEDLQKTNAIFKEIIPQIRDSGFSGIYLIASNPLDVMTYVTWKYARCESSKVLGSGTLLDTARLHCLLGDFLHISHQDVEGYVLGEHGDTSFVSWDSVNHHGITELEKTCIESAVKKAGFEVAHAQGYTCYGVASALARITRCILLDEEEVLPVCTYQEDFGIYISTPSLIGRRGVLKSSILHLSELEKKKLIYSVNHIKTAIGSL